MPSTSSKKKEKIGKGTNVRGRFGALEKTVRVGNKRRVREWCCGCVVDVVGPKKFRVRLESGKIIDVPSNQLSIIGTLDHEQAENLGKHEEEEKGESTVDGVIGRAYTEKTKKIVK